MRPRETILQFSGLALGEHHFEFVLDETFFSEFPLQDLEGLRPATVRVTMRKANHMLELDFAYEGAMDTTCDLSNEPFVLELKNAFSVVVKFGDAFDDSEPEVLVLPHGSYEADLKQYLFELVALSVPLQRVKPELREDVGTDEWDEFDLDFLDDEEE
ncbi:MAG: YceD family protein [Bacteroidota bacterium]